MAIELPITNGYYVSRHLPLSHQRCSNCYINIPTVATFSKEQLLFTPGISQLSTTGTSQQWNRGSHVKNGRAYCVNGSNLYRVNRVVTALADSDVISYTTTSLGTIEGTSRVRMADNGTQLLILVPGGKGYIYNEDDVTPFQEITDVNFDDNGNPQTVLYVDGYFLLTTDSKKFIVSALNDGLSYNALDFVSAESDPDEIVTAVKANNQVYILGATTTEGFSNTPSPGQPPFVRNGVILDKGCSAPNSVVNTNSTFIMVGAGPNENPSIWQFVGSGFNNISTPAIDTLLSTLSAEQLQTIYAITDAYAGGYFVSFTLPNTTLTFDLKSKRWTERNSLIGDTEGRWRVSSLVRAYGLVLAFDSIDGRIGSLSLDYVKEYENNIIRLFTTQPFTDQGDEVCPTMLELTLESGVGNVDEPNPVVSLSTSENGKTFGQERAVPIGKMGEYNRRATWYFNGLFDRMAVLKFRLSAPVKTAFLKLEME